VDGGPFFRVGVDKPVIGLNACRMIPAWLSNQHISTQSLRGDHVFDVNASEILLRFPVA